jgi:hypothetical protein
MIESVTLKKLDKNEGDRRGNLAVFKLISVPNMPYVRKEAIIYIQCLYAALGYNFWDQQEYQVGQLVEKGESYISTSSDGTEIIIGHKYWSDERISAFRVMVECLAPVHRWKVIKEY